MVLAGESAGDGRLYGVEGGPHLLPPSRCDPVQQNTAEDRIHGLELGADDYMTKPFSARELLLRISAILKRCSTLASEEAEVLRSGGLVLDLTARRVEVDGRQINLTPREFDLLTVLMSHPDVAFSRKRLLDIIWGGELSTDTRHPGHPYPAYPLCHRPVQRPDRHPPRGGLSVREGIKNALQGNPCSAFKN